MVCCFANYPSDQSFLYFFAGVLNKVLKTRPQLFEFILDILSNPSFSSVMTWEGTNGQFVIIRPDQVARLWGERNGRRNMTYQKFCRALRYYYRKGVLIKIRGRKFTYKFDLPELDRQYGYKRISFPATREPSGTPSFMIPATSVCATDVFPVSPSLMVAMPHENNFSPRSLSYSHYFPFCFEF